MIWCHGIKIYWASELLCFDDIDMHLKYVVPIEKRKTTKNLAYNDGITNK